MPRRVPTAATKGAELINRLNSIARGKPIPVFASPDRAADLNETLANRLVSQLDLMADPGTKFVPMFIGIRVDGGHTERAVF